MLRKSRLVVRKSLAKLKADAEKWKDTASAGLLKEYASAKPRVTITDIPKGSEAVPEPHWLLTASWEDGA